MNLLNLTRMQPIFRSGLLILLLSAFGIARGQVDVFPSSVDLRLVQGASNDQLLVQMKIQSTAGFGGILSALTVTIRYDAASGASLGPGSSFCNAWSSFTPSPVVLNNGIAYRTFNGFGVNRLGDPVGDGGCATILQPGQWFSISTIAVLGGGCTTFTMGNDAFTDFSNRDYYVSMGGNDVTGAVTSGPVAAGDCAFDCLGIVGGTALPGTPCDDGDPNTNADKWTANCECVGTTCIVPLISGTTNNSPVCSGNVLQLGVLATGTQPLSYAWTGTGSFTPNANSQTVSVSGAAPGNYQVTVSNECGSVQATVAVVVTTPPSATIAYAASPYCTTASTDNVTRTGSGGGTYSATPNGLAFDSSSGAIDPASSTPGNYTVTYSIPANGGCSAFSTTASIVISAPPSATIAYASSPYCTSAGTVNVARTGAANGTYSSAPSGLSINATNGAVNAANSNPGSYTVTYSIAASGGCSAFSTTASVVITDAPSATITYAGSPYCTSTGSVNVTRTGSTNGTYSSSPSGLSINGNSGTINLANSVSGSYTVTYSIAASGGCAAFTTTASVVIGNSPSATIAYTSSPYCTSAGTVSVTRTGSTNGTYASSPSGLSINANSGAINTATSDAGSYTVTYSIAASGGCPAFSATASVVITDAPSATIVYGSSPFCTSAGSVNVTRTGSTNGTYSATPSGLSISTNSGAINAGTSTPGAYTVTYNIAASGGCSVFSTTASVEITNPPSATILYFGSPYCTILGNVTVNRTGSTTGTYSATPSGLSINASSGAVHVGNSTPGTYTVTYSIAASGGCSAFSTTAQVSIVAPTIWYADADGDGSGDDSSTMQACGQPVGYVAVGGDLCPNDPNKVSPGVCGCGVPDTDTDLDGLPDCIDSCPTLSGEVGGPCDDGNAGTENDVITEDCICEGALTTSIIHVANANTELLIYPNPNRTGTLYLELPGSPAIVAIAIEILDISGRIILQTSATPQGGRAHLTLDLPRNIGAGNYTLQVIADGQRYVQRLVIY